MDVNAKDLEGHFFLHLAAKEANLTIARLLVERDDVDPDTVSNREMTPLHSAVELGYLDMAKLLIESNGVVIDFVQGRYKTSPLMIAVSKFYFDIAHHLIGQRRVYINHQEVQGKKTETSITSADTI